MLSGDDSRLIGGFLFMNISMAFSSSGSTIISASHSVSAAPETDAPSAGHSSSESASPDSGPAVTGEVRTREDKMQICDKN